MKTRCPRRNRRNRTRRFAQNHRRRIGDNRLHFEPLEDRRLLATLIVNDDGGADHTTIAAAIAAATAGDTIQINGGADRIHTEERITVDRDLTIEGASGSSQVIVQAHAERRMARYGVFRIDYGVTATIDNLTIRHGNEFLRGGGIYNSGTLTVTGSTLSDNYADSFGGGIGNGFYGTVNVTDSTLSGNTGVLGGGGIYGGTVNVANSTLSGNTAFRGGGINAGTVNVANSTLSGNSAYSGGGIVGTATVNNSIITGSTGNDCDGTLTGSNNLIDDNTCGLPANPVTNFDTNLADNGGPTQTHALLTGSNAIDAGDNALDNDSGGSQLPFDQRGTGFDRVVNGTVDIGAFEVQPAVTCPAGFLPTTTPELIACINDANASSQPNVIDLNGGTFTLTAVDNTTKGDNGLPSIVSAAVAGTLTVQNGTIERDAAASVDFRIFNLPSNADLTLNNVTIKNGIEGEGGAIRNSGGSLAIADSTFLNNQGNRGGAIFINSGGNVTISDSTFTGNTAGFRGAAIQNQGGDLEVSGSTFSANQSPRGSAIATESGSMQIYNSTLSGNTGTLSLPGQSAAIYSNLNSMTTVVNTTISGNTHAIYYSSVNSNLTVYNSILANSLHANGDFIDNTDSGTLTVEHSLIESTAGHSIANGADGNIVGSDPNLDQLDDYGGPTFTHALLSGSPAIDAGSNDHATEDGTPFSSGGTQLTTDQRGTGFPRIVGGRVDIGAYESVPVVTSQIIDDSDAGFSAPQFNGFGAGYTTNPPQGYQGNVHYHLASAVPKTATWTFDNLTPGDYQVAVTWTPHSNRANNSPFSLVGTTSVGTVHINQRLAPSSFAGAFLDDGVYWVPLNLGGNGGDFTVTGSTLTVKLGTSVTGAVLADAVRIEQAAPPTPEIEVLDGDSNVLTSGSGQIVLPTVSVGTAVVEPITIQNLGSATLNLGMIKIDSGDTEFTVDTSATNPTLAAGQSTTFNVLLDTSVDGTYNATVSIASDDGDENPFTFTVEGTVVPASTATIIDDSDAGFSAPTFTAFGTGYTTNPPQGYQGNVHYHLASAVTKTATWTFDNLTPGTYQVAVTWTAHSNRANNSPFSLDGTTNDGTVHINQRLAPSSFAGAFEDDGVYWAPLDLGGNSGNFMVSGATLTVKLSTSTTGAVLADAVRIEKMPTLLAAEEVIGDQLSATSSASTLDAATVAGAVAAGTAEWSRVDPAAAARLAGVTVQVANLPGNVLGLASASTNRIWIDANAAGHGWDLSGEQRAASREPDAGAMRFQSHSGSQLSALGSPLSIDLLSVVTHELGHVLGLPDLDPIEHPNSVMAERLPAATRRLPFDGLGESVEPRVPPRDWLFAEFGREERSPEDRIFDPPWRADSSPDAPRWLASVETASARVFHERDPRRLEDNQTERTEEDLVDDIFANVEEQLGM